MEHFYRYLPISDETRQQSLHVLAGGFTLIPPQTPYPPLPHPSDHQFRWDQGRTLAEYQLIYITQGGGVLESRTGGVRRIGAGDLFMLFPGEWHRYHPDRATGWDEYWVAFQGKMAEQLVAEYPLSSAEPWLHVGLDTKLMEDFLGIIAEMRMEAIGYQKVIAAATLHILARATATSQRRNFGAADILRQIERAKCLLLEGVGQPVNVEDLAAGLGVGYSLFRRAFREYTGLSPAQYHLELRLNLASELLRSTTIPIAAVGERAGFESPHYFSRIFKMKAGRSPREHRALSQRALKGLPGAGPRDAPS